MATYSTDLTTYTTAEAGTWTEFDDANSGGTPSADGENYIQGTDCFSQTTGTKSGTTNPKSVVFNNGSDPSGTWTTDDVFFIWCFYAVGVNLYNYGDATPGHQVGIANDTTNVDRFYVGGADYGRNPYGGWFNAAVDPARTADATYGTGGAGYQYVGSITYTINAISKGTPHAVDAIRYGRGLLSVTGTGSSFAELASYNDYNAGGTPPGTSSTSVDSGRHRLGLFQESGGTYLWKGLLSFGVTATSVTFSDSNETILIDDAAKTYAAFNKIEIHNASSSVTWTNITWTALGTVAPGNLEVLNNATLTASGCAFNGMGTFIFDSNTTMADCTFNGCGRITLAGADISGSNILAPTVVADEGAVFDDRTTTGATSLTEYDGCTFSQGTNAHHAIRFGTGVDDDITLTGIEFTGFSSVADSNGATLRFDATTGSMNVNLVNCTVDGNPATTSNVGVDDAAGITVTLVVDPKTTKVTVVDSAGSPISGVRVLAETADNGGGSGFPYQASVSTLTQTGGTATLVASAAHGLATNDYVVIRGAGDERYNKQAQITVTTTTQFTYTVDSGASASAGGTPVFSYAPLSGTTNGSGVIQSSKTWPASQSVSGRCRKSTSAPYYKTARFTIADASAGSDISVQMISDE